MSALFYGIRLQFKYDIRSKTMLITCYLVPLIFYAVMGGIFTSLMPDIQDTLIQSMTIMGVSMGALIGVPPTLVEIYGSDTKKMYLANGIPLYFGLCTLIISSFLHLLIMSSIILFTAPLFFHANLPGNFIQYYLSLVLFIIVSLSVACVLGLSVKNQAKLTMFAQLVFLPSIMLSGIMFPSSLLPDWLETLGKLFPAAWAYHLLQSFDWFSFLILLCMLTVMSFICFALLKKLKTD